MAKDKIPGGLADNKPDSDFDPKALKEGMKVEMEHTSDPAIAKEISKDHITENPQYYPALKDMERRLDGRKFKKSALLAKSPIIHEQDDDFTFKTLDDNVFNPHFHEMVSEQKLPNGLTHHIYKDKGSDDSVIHSLSNGDPEQPITLISGYMDNKGPYKGFNAHLTATEPEHQGKGYGTMLKELATKHHGRMVSDAAISPAEDRSWQKLKGPDIKVKYGKRFSGDTEEHPDDANEAAQSAHVATYKNPMAASEFKKSSLIKGVARRLFPFNPEKDINEMDEESIARWQKLDPPTWEPDDDEEPPSQKETENQLREDVPEFKGPAQKRSLLKLHSKTQSRRNPDTGKVEYLLHRGYGKGGEETIWHDHDNKISKIPQRTSWTPQKLVAVQFGIRQKGQSISAWIPEDHIVNVPKQYGIVSVMPEQDRRVRTENRYADEHEVIVAPGTFSHGTSAVQPTIDTEITRRGSAPYPTEPADIKSYAKKRGRFQKSSLLQKGAMRRLAPWNQAAKKTTSDVQADLSSWQEDSQGQVRNNLARYPVDESSRKRTLHKLSGMTPTKVHPDGTRSFLLHRGMSMGEYKNAKTHQLGKPAFEHKIASSWTPSLTISGGFASDAGRDLKDRSGAHASAWVHEDQIALMPNQHVQGSTGDDYKYEHEIIVKPNGVSPLVHNDEVAKLTGVDKDDRYTHPGGKILDNPDRMINFRQQSQKAFGGDPIQRNKHILPEFKRARFKKSSILK